MILKYFLKNIIFSRRIWFFGILFGMFMLYIAYSQSLNNITVTRSFALNYTGQWAAVVVLFLMGTVSTTIAQAGIYSSSSLPYLFKFSRYTRKSYLWDISFSSLIVSLGLSTVILFAAIGLLGSKFGFPVLSENFANTYIAVTLGASFMIFLAMFLVLVSINYIGARSMNYIHLLPLMMTYGFGILMLTTRVSNAFFFYLVPFDSFMGIFTGFFSGEQITLYGTGPFLSTNLMMLGLIIWIVVLATGDLVMLRRLRFSSLEEVVQI